MLNKDLLSKVDKNFLSDLVLSYTKNVDLDFRKMHKDARLERKSCKPGLYMDLRFRNTKDVADKYGMVVIPLQKAGWDFEFYLDIKTGLLFVLTKYNNIRSVSRKVKKAGLPNSIHYCYSLLSKNVLKGIPGTSVQLTLTDPWEVEKKELIESKREMEAKRILDSWFELVQEVVFIVGKEKNKKITSCELWRIDNEFDLIARTNLDEYLEPIDYEDAIPDFVPVELITTEQFEDENEREQVRSTVKLKKGLVKEENIVNNKTKESITAKENDSQS